MQSLESAIHIVYKECLKIKRNESLLILSDCPKLQIASSFFLIAQIYTEKTSLHILPEIHHVGSEPPQNVAGLMQQFDAIIILTSRSISHTQARRKACKKGVRIISLPNIQEDSLRRAVQWPAKPMLDLSRKIADILNIGRNVRLTTEAGTDLTFSIAKMRGFSDTGLVHDPGRFSNLPAGEGCIAPVQGTAQGTLVVDGSFPEIGLIEHPIRISVKDGQAARISGEAEAVKMRQLLKPFGKKGRNIAELGIGTNPNAKLTGCTLEDEKSLGSVHIALGNNISFDGKVDAKCHFDAILKNPTVVIDGKTILEQGKMLV